MNFRTRHRDEPEINLIPFIDVLLVVLIFLMLSTTYSKFTELQLTLPVADAEQQLLRIHVDDGFDFVKQLRTERVVGGRNHQADGVGDGAAQRARRIIDRIVEVCRGRSHAACDVVVFGAFAGKNAGDGGDGDVG